MRAVSIALECDQIKPIKEQEEVDNPNTPGPSSIRTRRAVAIPVLKKETKLVSSAVVLSKKMHAAFKLLADTKIEPERVLS